MTTTLPVGEHPGPTRPGAGPADQRGTDSTRSGLIRAGLVERVSTRLGWGVLTAILVVVLLVPTACFLVQAFSPRLFDQGTAWFTVSAFSSALQGVTLQGMVDSILVGAAAAILAAGTAAGLAWVVQRTTLPGRRLASLGLWVVLLVPSYVIAVGWQTVLDRGGLLAAVGLYVPPLQGLFFGPLGYTLVLTLKGVPFAYFAIAGPLAGLGRSFEEAARTHGGGRLATARVVGPILLPALLAALVVVFAESIADFGTAAVIAPSSNFPVATYNLFTSLTTYPADFAVAAVIGWLLVGTVACALLLQGRLLKGRSFAVLSGRSRFAQPRALSARGTVLVGTFVSGFYVVALGIPILGAAVSSLLEPFTTLSPSHLTLAAYRSVFAVGGLAGPIMLSLKMALINACLTVVIGAVIARLLAARRAGTAGRVLDLVLVAAIALPGLVLAAGYIFAFNLPFLSDIGLHLYGTLVVLGMAYLAGALPSTSRVLLGPMAQVQGSLVHAARVHGANGADAWRKGVLPLLARSLVWAWLLTFAGTFLELPASELLAPPGTQTVSMAIINVLGKSNLAAGTALSIVALGIDLGVILVVLGLFRALAPRGWRHVGAQLA